MSETMQALVLAGRRGPEDALAVARGVSHRAFLPVRGVPMLLRVVRALRGAERIGTVHVSIDAPPLVGEVPELHALVSEGVLVLHESEASPSKSVLAVLSQRPEDPFLVTTADHALLTPDMVDHFADAADATGADVAVGLVAASLLRRAYPESPRTLLRLRDESWSGANLFAFRTGEARKAAAFWVRAERHRKQPWRLVAAIGPGLLAGYATGRLDLHAALAKASERIGAVVRAVPMPVAEAAIDVDHEADLVLAAQVLASREARA